MGQRITFRASDELAAGMDAEAEKVSSELGVPMSRASWMRWLASCAVQGRVRIDPPQPDARKARR